MRDIVVRFKSESPFYEKEESGLKPNTVRKLTKDDKRLDKLIRWSENKEYGLIFIIHADKKCHFIRKVTDVTFWQDIVIISWRHPRVQENMVRVD